MAVEEGDDHDHDPAHEPMSFAVRFVNLLAVVVPFAGLVAAVAMLWGEGFNWVHLGLMLGMYLLTVLGITVGFHRLFTHRAFETNRAVKATLAILGSMAVQGPLLKWVATHRRHHQHSDDDHDPHSPHAHGGGVLGVLRGLWHAHVGTGSSRPTRRAGRIRRRPLEGRPAPQDQRPVRSGSPSACSCRRRLEQHRDADVVERRGCSASSGAASPACSSSTT